MSHSQFHSTNLFILRHAWLNLWDKHMTTGRINQVTTFPKHAVKNSNEHQITRHARKGHLSFGGSSSSESNKFQTLWPENLVHCIQLPKVSLTKESNRLVPRSHIVQTHRFLFVTTKIMAFQENYPATPAKHCCQCSPSQGGFPSVLIATSLAISK